MPIRTSPYFNNEAFRQAASNLSALFAPPSGAEAAGWATAQAKRDEAARLKWLFDNFNDPSASNRAALTGVQNYGATPEGFRYDVDQRSATQRYGYDTTAATTLQTNAADNARALEERRLQEAGLLQRMGVIDATEVEKQRLSGLAGLFDTVAEDASRPAIPAEVGAQFGVPGGLPAVAGPRSPLSESEVKGGILQSLTPEEQRAIGLSEGAITLSPGQRAVLPDRSVIEGAPKPLSETEWQAQQNQRLLDSGQLSDQMLVDTIMGAETPVKVTGPNGRPVFTTPGAAARQNLPAYEAPDPARIDNYLAAGPNGEEIRFAGYVGLDGRIHDANTQQPVPNVIRKEGTGGGISFEADGQGGIRFSTGADTTVARQTDLQRQEAEASRAANELTAIFDNIRADDVGLAGNLNDFLTDYGAQLFPNVARTDVAAMRNQMQASSISLARALVNDERLSDADRRAAQDVMVSGGLGESLPGARAKLASLIALSAYRQKFANTVRTGGEPLPPLDRAMLGRLVDEGAISPQVAQVYAQNVLSRGASPTDGPIPGVALSPAVRAAPGAPPHGVDPADWQFMTPEERALFQ